jgi:hypothetical protein
MAEKHCENAAAERLIGLWHVPAWYGTVRNSGQKQGIIVCVVFIETTWFNTAK